MKKKEVKIDTDKMLSTIDKLINDYDNSYTISDIQKYDGGIAISFNRNISLRDLNKFHSIVTEFVEKHYRMNSNTFESMILPRKKQNTFITKSCLFEVK